jgi:hypothetical protein
MGNWAITIIGTGGHHNKHEGDADKILKEAVEKLNAAGQNVEHASITHGGRDIFVNNVGHYPSPLANEE